MLKARRCTRARRRTSGVALLVLAWAVCGPGWAQAAPSTVTPDQLQRLEVAQQWDEIVRDLAPVASRTAEQNFVYASALAHLDRLTDAEGALRAGWRLATRDARFPVELAGIAFKQKRYAQASRLLRQALKLEPRDEYANDFLGTVYFLEGNIEAALKYWNRVGKPRVAAVRLDPTPRVDAGLLDSAFTYSPAATLELRQLLDSEQRVRGLGIFPRPQFDLRALPDGNFDVVLRGEELNGFGDTKLEALVQLLRELPFQGVAPEYDNARHEAINFNSLVRWDAQKRRVSAEVSTPFEHRAADRVDLSVDLRDENWAVRNGFTGDAPVLASLNLRREGGRVFDCFIRA
jgi:tetratricopeptide (TPR) repeat protein